MLPCNVDEVEGFHSGQVSAVGTKRRIVPPRDYEIFERMFTVSKGEGAAPGVDAALLVRDALFDEPFVTVSGLMAVDGAPGAVFTNHARASLLVSRGR
jgi:hypothetical protein